MDEAVLILVSCAGPEEAARIGRALVDQRLAACVHLRPHEAIYRWQGAVETAQEIGLRITAPPACAEAAMTLVRQMHSYEVPAIVCIPAGSDRATAAWLRAETQDGVQSFGVSRKVP